MNPLFLWQNALPPKPLSVTLTPAYVDMYGLKEECLFAVVFEYPDELCKKLFVIACPQERATLYNLFNQEVLHCEIDRNSNVVIRN